MRLQIGLLLLASVAPIISMAQVSSPSEAFSAGKDFGSSGNSKALSTINSGTATTNIPKYGTSAPESSYYQSGKGLLSGPAASKISGCQSSQAGDAYSQQECDAVNYLYKNSSTRKQYTISPTTDPIITGSANTIKNPGVIGGASNENCHVETKTTPATYIEETCDQYRAVTTYTCEKILNVTATHYSECQNNFWYSLHWLSPDGRYNGAYADIGCSGGVMTAQAATNDTMYWSTPGSSEDSKSGYKLIPNAAIGTIVQTTSGIGLNSKWQKTGQNQWTWTVSAVGTGFSSIFGGGYGAASACPRSAYFCQAETVPCTGDANCYAVCNGDYCNYYMDTTVCGYNLPCIIDQQTITIPATATDHYEVSQSVDDQCQTFEARSK